MKLRQKEMSIYERIGYISGFFVFTSCLLLFFSVLKGHSFYIIIFVSVLISVLGAFLRRWLE
ncbi:hypothetical protein GF327_04330 [Candidatus Woesearchaeota archaeon]|nr:hypothetical protein [Candidatus Woesearchaeota archaeon]